MIRLVTVIGHGVNLIPHFIQHYQHQVDEINIVVCVTELYPNIKEEVLNEIKNLINVKIVKTIHHEPFDWAKVTMLYNEIKLTHPDDWWVVADIDEFHIYPRLNLNHLINECDENGWEIVRGGFIDRIGNNGTYPVIEPNKNLFSQFPYSGFFRYPMSGACPNKICVMKGKIKLTTGQHYAMIDGHTTWRWQGWNHPLIAPYETHSVQVHHFKWDSTAIDRLLEVAGKKNTRSFSNEYRTMFHALYNAGNSGLLVDITNPEYMFEKTFDYTYEHEYKQWNKLIKKIVSI
jgi:hypothetical protein